MKVFPAWLLLLCVSILVLGCARELMISNPKRPVINPSQLQINGDQVEFTVKAEVPGGTLSSGVTYKLVPKFLYGGKEISFDPLIFQGSRKDQSLSKDYSFDYREGMEQGKLGVYGDFMNEKSGERKAYRLPLSTVEGIVTTPLLLEEVYAPAYITLEPYYTRKDTLILDYQFPLGRAELIENAFNAVLNQRLDSIFSSGATILSTRVIGTHSPIGSDEINRRIAFSRADVVEGLIEDRFKRRPKQAYDRYSVDMELNFNSWTIFVEKLKESNVWSRSRRDVERILSETQEYQTIKTRILELPYVDRIISRVFPQLQIARVEMVLGEQIKDPKLIDFTVKEVLEDTGMGQYSIQRILSLSQQVADPKKRLQLYEKANQLEPSPVLFNNWSATYLDSYHLWNKSREKDHLQKVYRLLHQSIDLKRTKEAFINLGIANAIAGRYDLSGRHFEEAKSLVSDDDSLALNSWSVSQGVAELKAGSFKRSYDLLRSTEKTSRTTAYNSGLAGLLAGRSVQSQMSFDLALELGSDSAKVFYSKAIAANRTGRSAEATKYLSDAFKINPRYHDYFRRDHEFENLNKALLPGYPDSLKRPVPNFKKVRIIPLTDDL